MNQQRRSYLNQMQVIVDVAKRDKRPFTTEERHRIATLQAADDKLRNAEPMPKLSQESLLPGQHVSTLRRGGKSYRAMFGDRLSSDGFDSFNSYLSVLHSGLHHPALRTEMLTQTGNVPSAGKFVVPEQFVAEMLDKSLESEIVRPRCDARPMISDTLKIAGFDGRNHTSGSLFGGFTASWMAENDSATDKTAAYRLIQLTSKKLAIFCRASNELIADGVNFEVMLGEAIVSAIGWHLDYACLRGTGAGQPLPAARRASGSGVD